jgi:hypothetical protein
LSNDTGLTTIVIRRDCRRTRQRSQQGPC